MNMAFLFGVVWLQGKKKEVTFGMGDFVRRVFGIVMLYMAGGFSHIFPPFWGN